MAKVTNNIDETQKVEESGALDASVTKLMTRVGQRVRAARERIGIPRRVLSEMSGVSPRYLAQLEAGSGNISIGLLERVAQALDHRIEWFVGEDASGVSEAQNIADLYRQADPTVQDSILQILNPSAPRGNRAQRICLLGLRGAGKSTLGRMASEALNIPFLELNHDIEDQGGIPVAEVMALYGPEGYRQLEAQALQRVVANQEKVILAVAGGIVDEPATYDALLRNFHTIWVRTSPDEHMNRVRAQRDERPMTGYPDAMEQLKSLLISRTPLYERALASIDTSGKTKERSLEDLIETIKIRGFLN